MLVSVDSSLGYRSQVQEREEISADAALCALGQLDPQSSARFEARLREGCGIAQSEYAAFVEIAAAALGASAPLYSPPPGLRDRVLARIVAEPLSYSPAPDASHSPMVIVRTAALAGCPGPLPVLKFGFCTRKIPYWCGWPPAPPCHAIITISPSNAWSSLGA